jgi:hypothetical protein
MKENNSTETKVITGKVRFSYVHVFEPYSIEEGQDKKYSAVLLIPKNDVKTVNTIKKAIVAAKNAGAKKNGGKLPAKLNDPLHDGDDTDTDSKRGEEYRGHYYINANAKTRPGLVDKNLQAIIDPEEFYSGCYGRASISFYYYDRAGNRGIGCGLNNLQKLSDGEWLGGRVSAEVDFADTNDLNDDPENDWG